MKRNGLAAFFPAHPRAHPLALPLVCLLACLLALSSAAFAARDGTAFKAGVFTPAYPAPAFTLQGSDQKELNLARFKGRAVLLFFGYTHCADVCPVTLATLAHARKQLGADGAQMQVVYITVDPERDQAERMAAYLRGFDAGFLGATGKPEALAAVRKQYGVVAKRLANAGGYAVDHSSSVFMIDREGRLRAMMPYGREAADYVHDLRLLLKP